LVPVNRITTITISVVLVAIAITTTIMAMVVRSVAMPIKDLLNVTRQIARTGDLHSDIVVTGQDEVAQLAMTFNEMIARLIRAQQEISQLNDELEQRVLERTAQFEDANKQLQETQKQLLQREKLAVLGQLSGGVAHELRNPLGAISNTAYLLNILLADTEPEFREPLEILKKEVAAANRVVNSLLDFARPKQPVPHQVELQQLLRRVLAQQSIPEHIAVETDFEKAVPQVMADPNQLEIVFGNLIRNAIQAMPNGGRLVVKTSEICGQSPEERRVAVSLADTGVGIPKEHLEKLFEPLFTTKAKGIGLGLALVKNLVEANRADIKAKSEVGEGTTFMVTLPVEII
jgi:two-component system NtrC family sensor kinase